MFKVLLLALFMGNPQPDSIQFIHPAKILKEGADFYSKGEYQKAVDLYLKISENDTAFAQTQKELMNAYQALKEYDKSIQIGKAFVHEATNFRRDFYINLGNAYLENGQIEEGKATYEEGLTHFPYSNLLFYNLGYANYKLNNIEAALACFQKSARLNPFYGNNHIMLGYLSMIQGHVSKALMSYLTYMAINPDKNSTLVFMDKLASGGARDESSVSPVDDNSYFSYYDDLIRSKAALDERFKTQVDFNVSIVKQSELLISKLVYDDTIDDFWMDFYVPFFKKLKNGGTDTAFLYFILNSTNNDKVKEWLQKHEKEKESMIQDASGVMLEFRSKIMSDLTGELSEFSCSYHDDRSLASIGNEKVDGTRIGPWEFYYSTGHLNAKGTYNDAGGKTGEWVYFHENGRLSQKENYDDEGRNIGQAYYYHVNGALSIVAKYNNEGVLDGPIEYYDQCGQIKESMPVTNGNKTGSGKHFFENGQLKINYSLENGTLDGDYIEYFRNGTVYRKYHITKGTPDGLFESFYANGQIEERGKYENDTLTGEWKGFHPNGAQHYIGSFQAGNRTGKWEFYHKDTSLDEIIHYNNEGNKHGEHRQYDEKGQLISTTVYDDGRIVGITCFGPDKAVVFHAADPAGNMTYELHHPSGELAARGTLQNGKLNGDFEKYHVNGITELKVKVVDDLYEGWAEEYFGTAEIHIRSYFTNGKKNGPYLQYYKNGQVEYEGWYENDVEEGTARSFLPDGDLDEQKYFITGKQNGWNHYYGPGNRLHRSYLFESGISTEMKQYDTLGNVFHHIKLPHGNGVEVRKSVAGDTIYTAEITCGIINSEIKYYFPGKKLMNRYNLTNGEFNGTVEAFFPDGSLYLKGNYKSNQRSGAWTWHYNNGKIRSEDIYKFDKIEGESKEYHYNGNLELDQYYMDGDLEGARKYYDLQGNHMLTKISQKGVGTVAYIDLQSGDTIPIENTGKFLLKSHYPNGRVAVEQAYNLGFYDGEVISYNLDGSLLSKISYTHGDNHGKAVYYFQSGKPRSVTDYKYDTMHGIAVEYYESGKKSRETSYVNGRKNGYEIFYHTDGTIKSKIFFWNDHVY